MARPTTPHPTDGELEILHVLWVHGPSPLSEVCTALREVRPVATTTVATMLRVMLDKRLVRRKQGNRGYLWSAAVTHDAAAQGMVGKLVDRMFDGSAGRLVAHLVEAGDLSKKDLDQLRQLIEQNSSHRTRKQ